MGSLGNVAVVEDELSRHDTGLCQKERAVGGAQPPNGKPLRTLVIVQQDSSLDMIQTTYRSMSKRAGGLGDGVGGPRTCHL